MHENVQTLTTEVLTKLLPNSARALFELAPPTALEGELSKYSLVGPFENPLEFWKENQNVMLVTYFYCCVKSNFVWTLRSFLDLLT